MTRTTFAVATLAVVLLAASSQCVLTGPVVPIKRFVNLTRYSGTWYEQVKIPQPYTSDCQCNTANYNFKPNLKLVDIHNTCFYANGTKRVAHLQGESRNKNNTELYVHAGPFGGPYWILALGDGPDYNHVMIGDPTRSSLWVLSRKVKLEDAILAKLKRRAVELGFDISKLRADPVSTCFKKKMEFLL